MDGRSTGSGGPGAQSDLPVPVPGLACHICFRRIPRSPVLTFCGHLFCWPCLYRSWPQQDPGAQAGQAITKPCPVCGIALREGINIVPIYGNGGSSPESETEGPITGSTAAAAAAAAASVNAIPPRPNPPTRIIGPPPARPPPARPLAPPLNLRLRNLASLHGIMGALGNNSELLSHVSPDRMRPYASARNIGLGVGLNLLSSRASSARMRRNRRLQLRMEGSGNIYESRPVDHVLADILTEMHATLKDMYFILSIRT